jgi:hypothetical protein
LIRAVRSAQRTAIRFAGRDRAGEGDAVDALVGDDLLTDVAGAGEQRDQTGRQVVEAGGEHQRRDRRQLGRLADDGVAGRQRGRELPGEQQQRVVPGDDRPDDTERLLEHERELGRLDRRDDPAGEVAAHLGVVVERGGGPADLVGVLDQWLAALERHRVRELVGPGSQPGRDLVQELGALGGRRRRPAGEGLARGGDRRVDLFGRGGPDLRDGLLGRGVLDG